MSAVTHQMLLFSPLEISVLSTLYFELGLSLCFSKSCPLRGYHSINHHLLTDTINTVNANIYLIRVGMGGGKGKKRKRAINWILGTKPECSHRMGFVHHKNWTHTISLIWEDRWHQTLGRRCFREDSNPCTDSNIHWSCCSHSVSKVWS